MRRNRKDKLPMHKDDKSQAAWERVLIGGWTAEQIKVATGISVRTVRTMSKVKKTARRGGRFQRTLIETVSGMQREVSDDSGAAALECLKRISWKRAWLLYVGVKEREITDEENAALLVRKLRGNIPDRLMLEPKVVALALKLYNASFPGQLKDAWEDLENHPEALKEARAAERRMAEQYQERVAKETEARTLASAAAKRQREGMERLKRLEEDAKARAALKSATAAQGDPGATRGADGSAQGQAEPPGPPGA
jgi:hypothetical protein